MRDFCNIAFMLVCTSILMFFMKAINGKISPKTCFLKLWSNYDVSTLKFITLIRSRD